MFQFRNLDPKHPVLTTSPITRSLDFLNQKFANHPNGIPLTKSLAFKRDLVAEAISVIQWPDWTEAEIYEGFMPIKVASEQHFEPFWELHFHLLNLKIVRHYKGKMLLSKLGKSVFSDRFERFHKVVQYMLFEDPHKDWIRQHFGVIGNWDIWLSVLDKETAGGATGHHITDVLYGAQDPPNEFDPRTSTFHSGVLKPLIYSGLLDESTGVSRKLVDRIYTKTALWGEYLGERSVS